jgi:hypothetical protein
MDTTELIDQMITDILAGNNVEAKNIFDQAIGLKVSDALDVAKVEVAQAIYSSEDEEDEEDEEDSQIEYEEQEGEDEDATETEE